MDMQKYKLLLARIREKCAREHWYGPDIRFLMGLQAPSFEAFMEKWAAGEKTCQWG